MEFKLTNISVILFVTTAINLVAAYIGWQRKDTKSGLYFAWGMVGITLWTLAAGLGYAAVPVSLKVFFAKVESVGYHSAISLFTLFALSYAGYDEWLKKKWIQFLFITIPFFNVLLTWTNDWHGLIWKGFARSNTGQNILIFEHGIGFSWIIVTGYLMIGTLILTLWQASRRGSELSKRQALLLFGASTFPVISNLVYLLGVGEIQGVDWTSLTFSVSGILFLLALYGTRFLDLVPIARHTMIERMPDCVLVLDNQDRILDFNDATQENFEIHEKHMGEAVQTVMAQWPVIINFLTLDLTESSQTTIFHKKKSKYFDIHLTQLSDNRGQLYGKLIIFRDVTTRLEAEKALAQKLFEIQELHKHLQDSQTQVVTHERTLAKLEERQRLGRDMHDSVNQSIHSLMLFSQTLEALLEKNQVEKALDISKRIQESGQQALKEIRLLVYETQAWFNSEHTDLISLLEERLNMVERRVGIKAEIIHRGDFMADFSPESQENLYWIAIEALNNSLKHAHARKVKISIDSSSRQLTLDIQDDGLGFDSKKLQTSGGYGMRTMQERATILNAQLKVESSLGHGTSVHLIMQKETSHG